MAGPSRMLIGFCAALLLPACLNYSEVELLGVQQAKLTRLDAQGLSATITVAVNNPNNFRITLTDPDVDLYLNGVAIGKADLDSALVLAPLRTANYAIPVHTRFTSGQNMLPLLLGSALSGSLKLGAKGTVEGRARWLRKRFPFEVEHQVELR